MPGEPDAPGVRGRATDAQFAQNPQPVAVAIGRALAELHQRRPPAGLIGRTSSERDAALEHLDRGAALPHPYTRVRRDALHAFIADGPALSETPTIEPVWTHGSTVVALATVSGTSETDVSVAFDPTDTDGLDPAERDLAIMLRSVAESFTSEVAAVALDSYERAGGRTPHGPTLDWYAALASFR